MPLRTLGRRRRPDESAYELNLVDSLDIYAARIPRRRREAHEAGFSLKKFLGRVFLRR